MSEAGKAQPQAWLCKHCNERVDPTMAWCWHCGHDKLGKSQQDLSSDIELVVRLDSTSGLTKAMQNRGTLLRLFFGAWCVTGVFLMVTGSRLNRNRYNDSRGPADELVIVLFHLSLLFTFMLIADRLVYNRSAKPCNEPAFSSDLHKPWIRRWMTRGWGSLLFWFAWAWVLLNR